MQEMSAKIHELHQIYSKQKQQLRECVAENNRLKDEIENQN